MKIRRDMHLAFAGWWAPPVSADVAVLAGDVAVTL